MARSHARLWRRFGAIAAPYWSSEERWTGWGLITLLVLLLLGQVWTNVLLNEQSGEFEVGRAIQAAGAFTAVLSALAVIVDNFESLSRFVAGVDRLNTFVSTLAEGAGEHAGEEVLTESVLGAGLMLERVTLKTPDRKRSLVVNLSVTIPDGKGLMIVGPSGGGKSSLLRAIAGLWKSGSGRIVQPTAEEMLFLPQHPYLTVDSLRGQLLYPHKDRVVTDDELMDLLSAVNLSYVAERWGGLDVAMDWGKVLSVGEQQRLAIARVLLVQPRFAMLDEATSALDAKNEETVYRQLQGTSTTLVSISHRATILKYHRQVLELAGDGNWTLHDAQDYRFGQ